MDSGVIDGDLGVWEVEVVGVEEGDGVWGKDVCEEVGEGGFAGGLGKISMIDGKEGMGIWGNERWGRKGRGG